MTEILDVERCDEMTVALNPATDHRLDETADPAASGTCAGCGLGPSVAVQARIDADQRRQPLSGRRPRSQAMTVRLPWSDCLLEITAILAPTAR
jgi:hypothetical protein